MSSHLIYIIKGLNISKEIDCVTQFGREFQSLHDSPWEEEFVRIYS